MIRTTKSRDSFAEIKARVDGAWSLLEIGSGVCANLHHYRCNVIVAVDVHRPYLENRINRSAYIIPAHIDARFFSAERL